MLTPTEIAAAVTTYWDQRAPLFNGVASHVRHEEEWCRVLAAAFDRQAPADVLDLGTGTGACALVAASLGHRVTAIDASSGMLETARLTAAARGLTIRFALQPIDEVDLPVENFDVVTIRNVLWTLADPVAALATARALLRPSGRIVVADALWSLAPADRSTYPGSLATSLPYHAGLSEPQCRSLLAEAGFDNLQSWQHLFHVPPYPNDVSCFVLSATTGPRPGGLAHAGEAKLSRIDES